MRAARQVFDEFTAAVMHDVQADRVRALTIELDLCIVSDGEFPVPVSTEILRLLDDEAFLQRPSSWHLAKLVADEWGHFPDPARPELLKKLRASFGRFSNFLGAFVTAEALAKHLDTQEAMATFCELYERSQPPARALVAHGLRELSLRSNDPRLRAQISQLLNRMMKDRDARVRKEAALSLSRMTP